METWNKFWLESRTRLFWISAVYFLMAVGVAWMILKVPFIREPHMWEAQQRDLGGVQSDLFGFWFGFIQPFLVIPLALTLAPNHWTTETANRTVHFSLCLPVSRRSETVARLLWFHLWLAFLVFYTSSLLFGCEVLMNYPRSFFSHLVQCSLNTLAFGVITSLWFAFSSFLWDQSKATAGTSLLVFLLAVPLLYKKESFPGLYAVYELLVGRQWFLKGEFPWRSVFLNLALIWGFCEIGIRRIEQKDF